MQVHAALLEACCVCGRRLSNVAFAALPGGGMAHVGCVQGN